MGTSLAAPRTRLLAPVAALSLAAVLLAACGGTGGDPPAGAGGGDALGGRTFVSTGVTVGGAPRPLAQGTQVALTFADGRLGVNAGCNQMGGAVAVGSGLLRLTGDLSMTEMACDEPRMAQDVWVSRFLAGDPSYELAGDRLTLADGDTTIELVDETTRDLSAK